MIRYKITHRYIGPLIACLCLGLSASSCVDDDAGCIEDKPGYVEGNEVWLSFTVKGEDPAPRTATSRTSAEAPGSLFSRADDDPDGNKHPAEAATDAENYINPTDIRLLLFDNRDCLMKIFDSEEILMFEHPKDDNNSSSYEIKVKINRAYFDYAGTAEEFYMSFMLIANLNGFDEGSVKPFPTAASIPYMKKHTALANEYYDFRYTPGTEENPWFPNRDDKAIPMSGLKKYTVSLAAIDGATDANKPYQLDGDNADASPLLLQRAIAKIRVFDNIAEDAATKITGFRIVGLNDHGTYLPDFSSDDTADSRYDWRNGTVMVEKASVKPKWFRPGLTAYSTRLEKSDTDYIGDFKNGDDIEFDEAFVAYIPEANLTTATDIPQLIITTKSEIDKTEANPDGIRPWTFSLKEIIKNEVIDITRNHIYEFTVTRSIDSQLTLNYTVCPWLTETVTLPPFD